MKKRKNKKKKTKEMCIYTYKKTHTATNRAKFLSIWTREYRQMIKLLELLIVNSHQASAQALSLGKTGLSSRYRSSFYREQQQQKYIVNIIS